MNVGLWASDAATREGAGLNALTDRVPHVCPMLGGMYEVEMVLCVSDVGDSQAVMPDGHPLCAGFVREQERVGR